MIWIYIKESLVSSMETKDISVKIYSKNYLLNENNAIFFIYSSFYCFACEKLNIF